MFVVLEMEPQSSVNLLKMSFPANIRRDKDVLKAFSSLTPRRLDQEEQVRLSHTSSEDVFKTSYSRPIYSSWPYVFKTSSRRLAKTSSRRFQDVLQRRLQDFFMASSRRFQDVLKTSSRHLQDVLQRYLQDVFKVYHQVNLFQLTRPQELFNTFLRRSFPKTAICRGICLRNTTSEKFMVCVQNLEERSKILKFQFFTLLHLFVAVQKSVFRTWANIYNDTFWAEKLNFLGSLKMVL